MLFPTTTFLPRRWHVSVLFAALCSLRAQVQNLSHALKLSFAPDGVLFLFVMPDEEEKLAGSGSLLEYGTADRVSTELQEALARRSTSGAGRPRRSSREIVASTVWVSEAAMS